MTLTQEEIRRAFLGRRLRAISVDTSVFDRQGLNLEGGLLAGLCQFKDSTVSVVLPDIVIREMTRHVEKRISESDASLQKAVRDSVYARDLDDSNIKLVMDRIVERDATEASKGRVASFLKSTGALILLAHEHCQVESVLEMYFSSRPPFGTSGKKKNEFPDAFALMSLEAWASTQKTLVLVVSHDGDWQDYGAESASLVVVEDLAQALNALRASLSSTDDLLTVITNNPDALQLSERIGDSADEQGWKVDYIVEADSQFHYDVDGIDADFEFVDFLPQSGALLNVVEAEADWLVVELKAEFRADVTAHFTFSKWDSVDGDYISMGSGSCSELDEVTLSFVITFSRDSEDADFGIDNIELTPLRRRLNFGEVEPDWMKEGPADDE